MIIFLGLNQKKAKLKEKQKRMLRKQERKKLAKKQNKGDDIGK